MCDILRQAKKNQGLAWFGDETWTIWRRGQRLRLTRAFPNRLEARQRLVWLAGTGH
jgi:hypothetical protein